MREQCSLKRIKGLAQYFSWQLRKDRALKQFWEENCDRRYMKSAIYPAIGVYLKNSKTKKVLDIGAQWYDVNNRDLFSNKDIIYWVIDVKPKPYGLKCQNFLRVSILDLPQVCPNLESNFDVVISYGVLGFFKFDKKSVNRYLENVFKLLAPNGVFLLKLDTFEIEGFEEEFKIDLSVIHKFFKPCRIADLPEEKLVTDGKKRYTFYTLKKRLDDDEERSLVDS
jgi:SAM-dependent methyltransferase